MAAVQPAGHFAARETGAEQQLGAGNFFGGERAVRVGDLLGQALGTDDAHHLTHSAAEHLHHLTPLNTAADQFLLQRLEQAHADLDHGACRLLGGWLNGNGPLRGLRQGFTHLVAGVYIGKGSKVSWPALRPLVKLMIRRAREGHSAFDSEQQNDPVAGEDAPFSKSIQFWVNRLAEWVFYGACDPSLGKAGNSRDPSAIGVGGYNRTLGILDVVEAKIKKRTPDRIISDVIEMQREYCCVVWGIESVQFQEFLRTELIKRSAQLGVPVPARALLPISDKLLRIESLQPHMHNGLIRLHSSQTTLVDQFRHFPKADHDDGPDMVVMLWMLAVTGGVAAAAQGGNSQTSTSARERYGRTAQRMFRGG